MSDVICLECAEIMPAESLLEPGWYTALPREQQAITTPDLGCPGCLSAEHVWPLEDLREMVARETA